MLDTDARTAEQRLAPAAERAQAGEASASGNRHDDLAARGRQPRPLFPLLVRHERLTIWLIFGFALILRLAFLGTFPANVTADELDFAGDAITILGGQGPPFFGLDWTQMPALSVYLISWSWRMFGMTIFAERLVSALLTALAIFPFYALVRRAVTVPSALAATLLFASSWWFLHFSRSGWNNGHAVLYTLLAAWTLTRALERRRWRDWLGFGLALTLLLYGYYAGRAVAVASLLYLALVVWGQWRGRGAGDWRRTVAGTLLAGTLCTILFLPMIGVALADLTQFTERTSSVFIFTNPPDPTQSLVSVLARQLWITVHSFVLMDPERGVGRYKPPNQGWLDPLSTLCYLVGLPLALRRWRAIGLWWSLFLVSLGMTQVLTIDIPDGARGLVVIVPIYCFVALALDALIARRWARPRIPQVALAGLIVLAVALNLLIYRDWLSSPQALAARQPAVPAAQFDRWRDYQRARVAQGLGLVNAIEYLALPPEQRAVR